MTNLKENINFLKVKSRKKTIESILEIHKESDDICIDYDKKSITYKELYKMINILSGLFNKMMLHRVILYMKNSPDFIVAYFALIKANITVIPLNTTLSVNELEDSYRFCNADLILIDEIDLNKKFSTDINYTSINQVRNFNIKMEGIYINTYDKKYDIILRTSGSTSNPKYVCFSEEKVMSNVIANIKALNITNNDIIYILLPMAFSYCMHAMVLSHLYVGAKLVIKTTTVLSQKQFYKIINEKHITSLGTVPQQLKQYMINDRYHENHLKKIFIGGDFAFKSFRKKVLSFFPDSDIYYTYGMTEAGPRISNCKCNLNNIDNESVGKALEGVIIELRDEYEEKINDINIEGEVVIKSSSIMCGYLKNNNMTNKVIRDGYLFTGDIGYFNEKKDLVLTGRKKNIVKLNGILIHLEHIEEILQKCESVEEVMVEKLEENNLIAYVVIKKNTDDTNLVNKLKLLCEEKLGKIETPKIIKIVDQLPKTSNGKIKRKK